MKYTVQLDNAFIAATDIEDVRETTVFCSRAMIARIATLLGHATRNCEDFAAETATLW
jgi:hypothetical protein